MKKIIDCFSFYNEIDLLTYRLNILNNYVDYFILIESTHTYIGKEKILFFNENKSLFEDFNNKIIHVIVNDFPHKFPNINISNQEQWINEKYQRNCIVHGINQLKLEDSDIIMISDLDEIPNPDILSILKNNDIQLTIASFEMDFYYYNLNSKLVNKWYYSKIISYKTYKELNISFDNIRFYQCNSIKNGGWHLSYFGDSKFIKNKIEMFSHQEYNNINYTDEEKIEERIKNSNDLFDRPYEKINKISIKDNNNLPPLYQEYLSKFILD